MNLREIKKRIAKKKERKRETMRNVRILFTVNEQNIENLAIVNHHTSFMTQRVSHFFVFLVPLQRRHSMNQREGCLISELTLLVS